MKRYFVLFLLLLASTILQAQVVANTPNDLFICDENSDGSDTNGFVQSFNLEIQSATILGTQSPSNFTVTYHESLSDASNGANALSSPYSNIIANTQTIYARVTENATNDFATTSFNINVSPLPTIVPNVELKQCDNDADGFSVFNLNDSTSDISSNFMNETFIFYETQTDAQTGSNPIPNPIAYENQQATTDIVWFRAISDAGCYRTGEITLRVSTTTIPNSFQRTFNVCDDFLDSNGNDNANNDDTDGVTTFDFSSVSAEILSLFSPSQQLSISYYRNQADAIAEQNVIVDPSNYRNVGYPNSQQIYVRVDSDLDNSCLSVGTHITLNVNAVPQANAVGDLELNDNADDGDDANGVVQNFNLSAQTPIILGGQNPSDYTVSYHISAADANANANAITDVNMYQNIVPNQQTIYVRVTNNTTNCFTDHTTFDLIVNPSTLSVNSENDLNVSLHPNPVDQEVILELPNSTDKLTILLFDIQGKLIQREIKTPLEGIINIDVSKINNGIYFLKMQTGSKSSIKKLIVNHLR